MVRRGVITDANVGFGETSQRFGTGVVSREEFEIAFGPDDDWQKEWEEEDRVNAVGGGHKYHPKCEWQHKHEQHDDGVSIPIHRDVIPASSNNSIDDLLGGAGPPLPRYDQQPVPHQQKKKVLNTTANVSIDDGTGLGDWASMGMAATLPDIAPKKPRGGDEIVRTRSVSRRPVWIGE